jgi:osmotically-inducible protein OsmY
LISINALSQSNAESSDHPVVGSRNMEGAMDDMALRQNVIDELEFEPIIDAAQIGVAVERGVVTLTGHVPTYAEKVTAEDAVWRVKGVRGIAQEIEVRPLGANETADDEIAQRALDSLCWSTLIPHSAIQIKVQDGWVTLNGKVDWNYQRAEAQKAVSRLAGVKGFYNNIEVLPHVSAADLKRRIDAALKRNAEVEAEAIRVEVKDGKVTLEGRVNSWSERRAAERAAWSAPGVCAVDDRITFS